MVPGVGIEPTRGCPQRFLRPPRLPFRQPGSVGMIVHRGYLSRCGRALGLRRVGRAWHRRAVNLRVALLADTHVPNRARDLPATAWQSVAASDAVIHAGDVVEAQLLERLAARAPLHVVRGNNDGRLVHLPHRLDLELGGVRIGVIHDSGASEGRRRRLRRAFPDARVVVYGHSHVPCVEDDGELLLVNPGSPTDRRRMPTFTMGELIVGEGAVLTARIVDLGRERA